MHENRCRLGLLSILYWRSLQRSPDSLAGFQGPTSKGRGRDKTVKEKRRNEGCQNEMPGR